jgi:hypothetical protein
MNVPQYNGFYPYMPNYPYQFPYSSPYPSVPIVSNQGMQYYSIPTYPSGNEAKEFLNFQLQPRFSGNQYSNQTSLFEKNTSIPNQLIEEVTINQSKSKWIPRRSHALPIVDPAEYEKNQQSLTEKTKEENKVKSSSNEST